MFTDIVGSTMLIEAVGDEAWEQLRRWHDDSLRSCFAEHDGEEIDHAGDGFFVSFNDPASAIDCAVNIQRRLNEHRRSHGFALQIRIGLHSAEATLSGTQVMGKGVHTAARIGALAEGGEIVASRSMVEASGSSLPTSNARKATLKGISEPVPVVTIDWR
jgi:class 3 adenylate cyclase